MSRTLRGSPVLFAGGRVFERIIATNLGVEDVPDEDAFELERGPNNCAASPM